MIKLNKTTIYLALIVGLTLFLGISKGSVASVVDVKGDIDVVLDGDTSTSTSGSTSANATSSTSSDSSIGVGVNAGANANVFSDGEISIDQSDAKSESDIRTTLSDVGDEASFSSYVRSTLKSDSKISEVSADEDNVEVEYDVAAKFLGIFPFTTTVTVSADNEGSVNVKYPWYRFLISAQDSADLEANVESRVKSTMMTSTNASTTVSAKAEVVEAIVSALQEASASASVNANTSGEVSY